MFLATPTVRVADSASVTVYDEAPHWFVSLNVLYTNLFVTVVASTKKLNSPSAAALMVKVLLATL